MSVVHIGRSGSAPPPNFSDPVAVLVSCHRKLEDRLRQLERAGAALSDPEALPLLREIVRHFETAGARHTEDEEASIFPRLAAEGLDDTIAALEGQHRETEAIFLAVRTVVLRLVEAPGLAAEIGAELRSHAAVLAAAYREHIRREEAEIFPRVARLDAVQLRAIGIEMRLRRGGGEP